MGQPLKRTRFLADEDATGQLARQLAKALPEKPRGWVVLLQGELGSGKSTLARAMLRSMGHAGPVPSPTYTLVEPYEFPNYCVYHIDLYRIADPDELEFLGWSDLADGLRLVEWPERIPGLQAVADVLIQLGYEGSGRVAELTGLSERGARLVKAVSLA
jgi:tRNA threonylcarbamoyladenosine biosynthesis protein TsaE